MGSVTPATGKLCVLEITRGHDDKRRAASRWLVRIHMQGASSTCRIGSVAGAFLRGAHHRWPP